MADRPAITYLCYPSMTEFDSAADAEAFALDNGGDIIELVDEDASDDDQSWDAIAEGFISDMDASFGRVAR